MIDPNDLLAEASGASYEAEPDWSQLTTPPQPPDDEPDWAPPPEPKTRKRKEKPSNAHAIQPGTILDPHERTEAANARRLAKRHGNDLRYVAAWDKWLVWDGARFAPDDTRAVDSMAKELADIQWQIAGNALEVTAGKTASDIVAFAKATSSRAGIGNMIALTRSEPGIPIAAGDLDRHPMLLNCLNGTLDLETGRMRPHDRADLLTKVCPIAFDPAATCSMWERTVSSIFAGNDRVIQFVKRLAGYSITGRTTDHVLPIGWGQGSNGKSLFLNTLLSVLGNDYGMKAPQNLLMQRKHESHPTERADLFGRRMVAAIETEKGQRLAESLVKELTGGDVVRARRMREDFWEFIPSHKIWLACNDKPVIRGTDHGIWRRVCLIPFTVQFWNAERGETGPPELEADKDLQSKLWRERAGILRWLVEGCQAWQREGLNLPDEVKAATADYRAESDVLSRFIASCCIVGNRYSVGASALLKSFLDWCEVNGERPMSGREFGQRLNAQGYDTAKDRNGVHRLGIGLLADECEPCE